MPDRFTFTYQIQSSPEAVSAAACAIAVEQTIEMPEALVDDPWIQQNIIGNVLSTIPLSGQKYAVKIAYDARIANNQFSQFLNLLYGNISLQDKIKIIDIEYPVSFLDSFSGPRWGTQGLREKAGIAERPLIASALKPLGSSPEALAELCYNLAVSGVDIIKDDHSLGDHSFCPFDQRLVACMEALRKAEQETGKKTLYFPNVIGPFDLLCRYADQALAGGAAGVVMAPFITGMETALQVIRRFPDLCFLAHPAFSGAYFQPEHGISPDIVLGDFMRLIGFDGVIFPHAGGRFPLDSQCGDSITKALKKPLGNLNASLAVPAGGMKIETIADAVQRYGRDVMFLIGGALRGSAEEMKEKITTLKKVINCPDPTTVSLS